MKYLGAHLSSSGSFDQILKNAISLNCNAIQFFLGGRISWNINLTDEFTIENNIKKYVHSPYVINIANMSSREKFERSIDLVKSLLFRGEDIGLNGIVVHTGSIMNLDISREETLQFLKKNLVEELQKFIEKEKIKKCKLILEPSSGQGSSIAHNQETIESYFSIYPANEDWWGICIDTCHIYTAGLDLHNKKKTQNFFNLELLKNKLLLIHLNNTEDAIGSRKDRHRNINAGNIKIDELLNIIDTINQNTPIILETPGKGREEDLSILLKYRKT